MRVAFVTWDGGGNETVATAIAEKLRDDGDQTLIVGYGTQRERLAARGLEFVVLPRADGQLKARLWRRDDPVLVMASEAQRTDVEELLATDSPDLVVVDCLLFGALAAVERASVPAVTLIHSPPGCLLPRGGLLESVLARPVTELRDRAQLARVA